MKTKSDWQSRAGEIQWRKRLWASSFVLLAGLIGLIALGVPKAALAQEPATSITVLVYNYRQAPSKTLTLAEREAENILAAAGVHAAWLNCPVGPSSTGLCQRGPGAGVVKLSILGGHAQGKFLDTIAGVAVVPAVVGVYYDYTPRLQLADDNESNRGIVLGCVIAHEIGHLLLGSHAHSVRGIMQARWGTEQLQFAMMGKLLFLPEESKLMQAQALTRVDRQRNAVASLRSSP